MTLGSGPNRTPFENWLWNMSGVDVHELLISFGIVMPYVAILIIFLNVIGRGLRLDWRRGLVDDDCRVPESLPS